MNHDPFYDFIFGRILRDRGHETQPDRPEFGICRICLTYKALRKF